MSHDLQLNKRLTWVLRHGALQENIPIRTDGFVPVDALLRHPKFARDYSLELLQRLVHKDNKGRFTLRQHPRTGAYEIRANQGHSIPLVQAEECFERIRSAAEVPMAVHGTYYRHWPSIKAEGLRRMQRTHVHFAAYDDRSWQEARQQNQQDNQVVSGFRQTCELLIYLNVLKVMEEESGMELYRSSNNVILCAGLNGSIPKEYFAKVVDRRTGQLLEF